MIHKKNINNTVSSTTYVATYPPINEEKYTEVHPYRENNTCAYCPNYPANGGSGICHCILGQPQLTW